VEGDDAAEIEVVLTDLEGMKMVLREREHAVATLVDRTSTAVFGAATDFLCRAADARIEHLKLSSQSPWSGKDAWLRYGTVSKIYEDIVGGPTYPVGAQDW
jgi:hypothetical protein